LLGKEKRIVDLDAEVAHGAFQLCMAEKELTGAQISGAPPPAPLISTVRGVALRAGLSATPEPCLRAFPSFGFNSGGALV
jgi:hypothetical protein